MITRFDHAVIAVPDIEEAIRVYAALGFDVAAGGRHPAFGTRNAIVRFGLDYLELLAVEDAKVARERGPFGVELAAFLEAGPGLVGFVLASARLEDEATGLDRIDIERDGPFAMDRERPDGRRLAWRLVVPGRSPWRKPWPFLIQWETPDADRLAWDGAGAHENRVTGVAGLELLVDDVAGARRLYEEAFGLSPVRSDGHSARYEIGGFALDVLASRDPEMTRELGSRGPGPWRLRLLSEDVGTTAACFGCQAGGRDIDPGVALGARLRIDDA